MIKFKALTMRNFLSVGNNTQAMRLDKDSITLILGQNHETTGEVSKNGAGKSTILQALCYALWDNPLTKIKADNLVNNINNKAMYVTLDFEVDGVDYRIERGRKPRIMRFFVKGEEIKDEAQGENRHTQDTINKLVGMSFTLFKLIVTLNTFTEPFLRMPVKGQRDVIEDLFSITQLSERADALRTLVSNTKDKIRDEEATIRATNEANNRINDTIARTIKSQAKWKVDQERKIDNLLEDIKAVSSIDFEAELKLFEAYQQFVSETATISRDKKQVDASLARAKSDLMRVERDRERSAADLNASTAYAEEKYAREKTRLEADIDRTRTKMNSVKKSLEEAIYRRDNSNDEICICCGQSLEGTDHLSEITANINKQIAGLEEEIADYESHILYVQSSLEDAKKALDQEVIRVEEVKRLANERIVEIDADIASGKQEVVELTVKSAELDLKAKELLEPSAPMFSSKEELLESRQMRQALEAELAREKSAVDPHVAHIEDLQGTILEIDYTGLNDLSSILKHQEFLFKLLTSKDSFIRKKIIDQNLYYLNTRMNKYLEKLGLPHEVVFQPDLSVTISLLGRDFDFEQLSRGEMNRVILSTSWAFRDVWESMNGKMNLLFVDEMLDQGTDGSGAEAAIEILKNMAMTEKKNVFLISHRDELAGKIDTILLAHKENRFTEFTYQ